MNFRDEFWEEFSSIEIARDLSPEKTVEKLNEIEARLRPHLPKSVFKYRACNSRNFDALARNVLYAVPASYMNDPFDGLVYVDLDKILNDIKYGQSREFLEYVRENNRLPGSMERFLTKESYDKMLAEAKCLSDLEIEEREKVNNEILPNLLRGVESFVKYLLEELQKTTLISSLASDYNQSSMWAYYAADHTGYAVEYAVNGSRLDKCATCDKDYNGCPKNRVRAHLYPIVYMDNRYDATSHIDYTLGLYALQASGMTAVECCPDMMFFDKCCLIKGKQWESENEWRLVCHQEPLVDEHLPVPICMNPPKAIYYGERIAEENFRLLHSIVEKLRSEGADIKEYRMYLDPFSQDFNLKCKEI